MKNSLEEIYLFEKGESRSSAEIDNRYYLDLSEIFLFN